MNCNRQNKNTLVVNVNQGWQSHRNRIAPFFPKKSHLHIASKSTKNRICYRISKLNKNNLRLFQFLNKLPIKVLYLVASCDCFVISMFSEKEKFEFGYDLLHASQCKLHSTWVRNREFQEVQIK